jgi:hypothetical protein
MNLSEETIEQLDKIHSIYAESTREILVNEARENNPYKVGDTIKDHFQIGKIKQVVITTNVDRRTYSISYKCEGLTKKLKAFKNSKYIMIFGANVERKIANS